MKNRKRCRKEIGKRHIFKEIVWSVWGARNRHENRWRTRFIEILLFVLLHNRRRRCSSLQRLKVSALNPFPRPSPVILRSRQSLNRPRTRFNGKKNEFLSLPANSSRRVSRRLFSIFQQFYIFPSLSSKSSSFLFFYFFIFIIFASSWLSLKLLYDDEKVVVVGFLCCLNLLVPFCIYLLFFLFFF